MERGQSTSDDSAAGPHALRIESDRRPPGWISLKCGVGYEWLTAYWGMGVCSGRRPLVRHWVWGYVPALPSGAVTASSCQLASRDADGSD